MKVIAPMLMVISLLFSTGLLAADIKPSAGIQQRLKTLGITAKAFRTTPIKGLVEIQVGNQIYYITEDGAYLLAGSMLDLAKDQNLTQNRMNGVRAEAVSSVGANRLISFKAGKPKYHVTVFTDIDCSYCRKLHSEMDQYNGLGITVDYLFYPRTGVGSRSYNKAVSVWCNKDRLAAMTRAKSGAEMPTAKCENPVSQHYQLGEDMGIRGTPAIITEQGEMLPGYVPPADLLEHLQSTEQEAKKLSAVSAK